MPGDLSSSFRCGRSGKRVCPLVLFWFSSFVASLVFLSSFAEEISSPTSESKTFPWGSDFTPIENGKAIPRDYLADADNVIVHDDSVDANQDAIGRWHHDVYAHRGANRRHHSRHATHKNARTEVPRWATDTHATYDPTQTLSRASNDRGIQNDRMMVKRYIKRPIFGTPYRGVSQSLIPVRARRIGESGLTIWCWKTYRKADSGFMCCMKNFIIMLYIKFMCILSFQQTLCRTISFSLAATVTPPHFVEKCHISIHNETFEG